MIVVGVGQIFAGTLLVLSTMPLWAAESYFLALLDGVMGVLVLAKSIVRDDPPAGV